MNNPNESKEIECKMCKKITKHLDIGFGGKPMWKCMRCGEYNQPKEQSDGNS